jgi:hypothetical protein
VAERTIRIDNLHLNVPHMSGEQAHRLAHDVTQHIADSLPDQIKSRDLGLLKLNLTVPKGADQSQISVLVAQAIVQAMS